MKAFARLREEKGKAALPPKLGLKLKTPLRQSKKDRHQQEDCNEVDDDVLVTPVTPAATQKRALRRPLAFQPTPASAPRGRRVESARRAASRDDDSGDDDDSDDDEQREKVARTKRPKVARSAKSQVSKEERLEEKKQKQSNTTKRKSVSTSEGESDEEEDEMEGSKEVVLKRKSVEVHKAAPVVVEEEEEEEDGIGSLEEPSDYHVDDEVADEVEEDEAGEEDEVMEEQEEYQVEEEAEGEEEDDDSDSDGEEAQDLASLVISRLEALNLLDSPEPTDASKVAPQTSSSSTSCCPADVDVPARADEAGEVEADEDVGADRDDEVEVSVDVPSEEEDAAEEEVEEDIGSETEDEELPAEEEISDTQLAEIEEAASLNVDSCVDEEQEVEAAQGYEVVEEAVDDAAPEEDVEGEVQVRGSDGEHEQASEGDDDDDDDDDERDEVVVGAKGGKVSGDEEDDDEEDSKLVVSSAEDFPENDAGAEEEELEEDEEAAVEDGVTVADYFDQEAEEEVDQESEYDKEENEDEDESQSADECCRAESDQEESEEEAKKAGKSVRPVSRCRSGCSPSASSASEEEDGGDGEAEEEEEEEMTLRRSMRSEVEERKKRLERLRKKILARRQAGLTPMRKTKKKQQAKCCAGESDSDEGSDGVEIGGKRLRARAGRVRRLKREGDHSAQRAGPSTVSGPRPKNEDELLNSLFGGLTLGNEGSDSNNESDQQSEASESESDDTAAPTVTKKPETKNEQEKKTVSPPWYAKPGVMASIKYTRPAMTRVDNNANQSQPAKEPPTSRAAEVTPTIRAATTTKAEVAVTIDLLSSDDDDESLAKPAKTATKNEARKKEEKEEEATRTKTSDVDKRSQTNAKRELKRKMEKLKREMEELKRRKEALENARQKKRQQRPSQESSDSESAPTEGDDHNDSSEDSDDHVSTSAVRTPPSGSSACAVVTPATPFVRTTKGAMIATPSPATPRRPAANKENVAPGESVNFQKQKEELTARLFKEYNKRIFGDQLPADMSITWVPRLTKTAGRTICKRKAGEQSAAIELSVKVLTEYKRLRNTLCHELCHAAAWLLDNTVNPPHGPLFFKWARKAEKVYPDLDIKTCHSYDIECKYQYQCTNASCGAIVGRHSKSVDLETKRCGKCMGKLRLLPKLKKDGTPANSTPNAYALFMKENYARIKQENPSTPTKEVMKLVSLAYQQCKQQTKTNTSSHNSTLTEPTNPVVCPSPYIPPRSLRQCD